MRFNLPKNSAEFYWTDHIKDKMIFYGLSAQKIKGIIRRPDRREPGVAKNTVAAMQRTKSKRPTELWVMFQKKSPPKADATRPGRAQKIKNLNDKKILSRRTIIISAWRYPGVSKVGQAIPIPEDIKKEIINLN